MSVSFTQYNVAAKTNLLPAVQKLNNDFFQLGLHAVDSIASVGYDASDNSFVDQAELGIAPIEIMAASPPHETINQLQGFSINFLNSDADISLSVRLINYEQTSISILELSGRQFYKFFKSDNVRLLTDILLASADCINAVAGFGAMETEWEPYSEDAVIHFIVNGPPEYQGNPSPIGLIQAGYLQANSQLLGQIQQSFDISEKNGYKMLLRKGASQLFASLQ